MSEIQIKAFFKLIQYATDVEEAQDRYTLTMKELLGILVSLIQRPFSDLPIHTSLMEGINNKIKVIRRKAYGISL